MPRKKKKFLSTHQTALSAYRIMWIFVFFDLPTETSELRKEYTLFRKKLLKDGFQMQQFSVYRRFCGSRENADVHIRRVRKAVPPEGMVSILLVTDKQFGEMINIVGAKRQPPPKPPQQLTLL
ncbi:MAG: CRISPR-associated endonuclease Cas2 [Microscillaceae bacterium]|nr:CRISPR-associated endonuclease Cas2 [Microscillaceae bacterium]MDW8459873.1 CRISPR-associated endonuclease Cas2 [Cytophagales bacterium]